MCDFRPPSPRALGFGGERDVGHRQVGGLDQHPGGLRALGAAVVSMAAFKTGEWVVLFGMHLLAFFFIAFWRSPDPFMAAHWGEIAIVDYCFKVLISIVFFLPMYGMLLNMLLKKLADKSDLSALQPG